MINAIIIPRIVYCGNRFEHNIVAQTKATPASIFKLTAWHIIPKERKVEVGQSIFPGHV